MQFITIATALFAGLAAAAPAVQDSRQAASVELTYIAPDGTYTVSVPIGGGSVKVASNLSFSHISSKDPTGKAVCKSVGVDKDPTGAIVTTTTVGSVLVDIGPPQVQTGVTCTAS